MLKLSKTAIRELSKMYRAVLMGAMVTLIATGAQAADGDVISNGTEIVAGTSGTVIGSVEGLGTAAYTNSDAYDAAGSANTALTDAKAYADSLASNYDAAGSANTALTDAKAYADGLATNYDAAGSASAAETAAKAYADGLATNYDAAGSASAAETAAKAYADNLLSSGSSDAKFDTLETTGNATIGGDLNAGATTVDSLDAGSGEIKTTGAVSANEVYVGDSATDGYLEVSGTTGKFVILDGSEGGVAANYMMAYEIGSLGTLDVLISDPSQPDTYRSVFQADTNGNVTNDGTITSGGLITANGGLTVKNGEDFTLGGTAVNAIDTTGVNRNTPGDTTTLTTTSSVVNTIQNQAEDATYTNTVTNNSNVTANTLNGAIANLDNAIGNRTLTSSNGNINAGMATSLSAGLQAAGNAIGSLNYSSTNYVRSSSDLTTAISALDNQLYQLNNSYNDLNEEVKDMNKEMKAGFASVAALSGLQPNARAFNDTQISVGVGNYRGQTGFALGGFHYVNDNLMMNVGAAYAGDHSATFRGGLTFGW